MRYLPKSPAERQEMLAAIGVKSVEELFSTIPEAYRLKKPLNLPGPLSEPEVIEYFQARAAENSVGYTSFLGAGVYNHLRFGHYRYDPAARRIPHFLHALSGGNFAGNAAGHL